MPIQSLAQRNTFLIGISEVFIEADGGSVFVPYEQIEFPNALLSQPVFRGSHDLLTEALAAVFGMDGNIIDRPSVTIMTDHCRGDQRAAIFDQKNCRV